MLNIKKKEMVCLDKLREIKRQELLKTKHLKQYKQYRPKILSDTHFSQMISR